MDVLLVSLIQHQYIDLGDVTLHLAYAGPQTGPLILFLHGFPENWYEWKKQLVFFSKKGFLAVAPDQRGYNLSSKPRYKQDYRIDLLAIDVIRIANHFKKKKFYLVGHDWGANVAWWTSLRYPSRLEKLVIINVPHPIVMKKLISSFPNQMFKSWYIFFFQIPLLSDFFVSFNNGLFLSSMITSSSNKNTFSMKRLSFYRHTWSKNNISSMVNWYRGMGLGSDSKLSSIKVKPPCLLLWGLKDKFIAKESIKPSLKLCSNGKVIIFPNNTHWLVIENSSQVSQEIESFLES